MGDETSDILPEALGTQIVGHLDRPDAVVGSVKDGNSKGKERSLKDISKKIKSSG